MKIASNKIKDIIRFFKEQLSSLYEESEIDVMIRYCFEEFSGIRNVNMVMNGNDTVSESELLKYSFAVKDLKNEKPLQYILGKADFYGLKFFVNENVLIPRPETEELVHLIINDLKELKKENSIRILDIGTGSGCIPITLKKKVPEANVMAIDVSLNALEIAKKNAKLNNAEVEFIHSDILDQQQNTGLPECDIIVSNPPYIKLSEKETMNKNVLDFEPHIALFVDGPDPLLFYNAIADLALKILKPEGRIYFEINESLGPETRDLIEKKGFKNVELIKDINNKNRILRGTLSDTKNTKHL
jgi:release factor glutamine methyltransferase